MHFYDAKPCIFQKRLYLCIVFFIVLDLRLTRLGYSGIPFFFIPTSTLYTFFVELYPLAEFQVNGLTS